MKTSLVTIVLAFLCGSSTALAQLPAPRFVSDSSGATVYLNQTGSTSLSPSDVGVIYASFNFQTTEYDAQAGEYVQPDLLASYKLTVDSKADSWYLSNMRPMYYGVTYNEAPVTVLSFDSVTGVGTAELAAPLGLVMENVTWGDLRTGAHTLVFYWGERADLQTGSMAGPIAPWGNMSFSIMGVLPPVSAVLGSNRGMFAGNSYRAAVILDAPATSVRTFDIASTSPSILEAPLQVTIPVGESHVAFNVEAREPGTAYLAVSEGGVWITDSELGLVTEDYAYEPWAFEHPSDFGSSNIIKMNSRCKQAKAIPTLPAGTQRLAPQSGVSTSPSGLCLPEVSTEDEWKAYKPRRCTWYSFLNNCKENRFAKVITVQKWELVDMEILEAGRAGIEVGKKVIEIEAEAVFYRIVCVYEAKSETKQTNVPNCRTN